MAEGELEYEALTTLYNLSEAGKKDIPYKKLEEKVRSEIITSIFDLSKNKDLVKTIENNKKQITHFNIGEKAKQIITKHLAKYIEEVYASKTNNPQKIF